VSANSGPQHRRAGSTSWRSVAAPQPGASLLSNGCGQWAKEPSLKGQQILLFAVVVQLRQQM
jgi:hypothetical protein